MVNVSTMFGLPLARTMAGTGHLAQSRGCHGSEAGLARAKRHSCNSRPRK